jgi:3-oxoadipate enol-lactonase
VPIATLQDIGLYYEVHGRGDPLVMITGYGDHSGQWFRQVPGLARHCRAIAFDNRGAGRTDKPDVPYTMRMLAGDIAGLLHALSIDSAHIYGVSMGGMVAQEFALEYPEMTLGLVLGGTTCGGAYTVMPDDEVMALLTDNERMNRLTPEEAARETFSFSCSPAFIQKNPQVADEYVARAVEYPTPPYVLRRQMEAILAHDTYDRLPDIGAPTLVICGGADRLMPAANSKLLASRIPVAQLLTLEGVGHGFCYEAPDEANTAIVDFLNHR